MHPDLDSWHPVPIERIDTVLGGFRDWCLCGGQSIDVLAGRKTREHGDTDIGVFRSDIDDCLSTVPADRVFLCDPMRPWDGKQLPSDVYHIWICNQSLTHWELQIMVYDDDGDHVIYRRDPRVSWPKTSHTVTVEGVTILNPAITLLFKSNRSALEEKDTLDLQVLIAVWANRLAH